MAFFSGILQKAKDVFVESEEEKKRRKKFQASVGRLFGRASTTGLEIGAAIQRRIPQAVQKPIQERASTFSWLINRTIKNPTRDFTPEEEKKVASLGPLFRLGLPMRTSEAKKQRQEDVENLGFGVGGTAPAEGKILTTAAKKLKLSPEMLVEKLRASTMPFAKRLESRIAQETTGLIAQVGKKAVPQATERVIPLTPKIKITEPRLKVKTAADVGDFIRRLGAGEELPPEMMNQSQRYFKNVADMMRNGRIKVSDIPSAVRAGFDDTQGMEVADLYEQAASYGGKFLNQLSQDVKVLSAKFPEVQPTEPSLNIFQKAGSLLWRGTKQLVGLQGAALVSNIYTALRNFEVTTVKVPMQIFSDIVAGGFETIIGKAAAKQAFSPVVNDFVSLVRILSGKEREQMFSILERFPAQKARFFGTPIAESITGSKIANVLTIMNKFQDMVVSTYRFNALTRSYMTRKGFTSFGQIPVRAANSMITDALRFSFRGQPQYKVAQDTLKAFDNPIAKMGLFRFPRFFALATEHIFNWSPFGYSRLLFDKAATANPRAAFDAIGQATTGSMLLGLGYAVRKSDMAGDKWYEVKVGDKVWDVRNYQPISSYLFMGELLNKGLENMSGQDLLQGALSINRITGTSLAFIDAFRGKDPGETLKKVATNWAGQVIGGFSVPLKQLSIALGALGVPGELVSRSTKEQPLLAPFIANIPFARNVLPELPYITREEPIKVEHPLLRLAGISLNTSRLMEREMKRLKIETMDVLPSTGDPFINRLITEEAGPIIERAAEKIKSPQYMMLTDPEREEAIRNLFSDVKKEVKVKIGEEHKYEIAARFYEELLKAKDREERNEIWGSWTNNLGKNFMEQIREPIMRAKNQNLSPDELYRRLRGVGQQTPLEVGGFRVP